VQFERNAGYVFVDSPAAGGIIGFNGNDGRALLQVTRWYESPTCDDTPYIMTNDGVMGLAFPLSSDDTTALSTMRTVGITGPRVTKAIQSMDTAGDPSGCTPWGPGNLVVMPIAIIGSVPREVALPLAIR